MSQGDDVVACLVQSLAQVLTRKTVRACYQCALHRVLLAMSAGWLVYQRVEAMRVEVSFRFSGAGRAAAGLLFAGMPARAVFAGRLVAGGRCLGAAADGC